MPADPLAFRLLQNLQTVLRAIHVNVGYHYTVPSSVNVKLDPDQGVEDFIRSIGSAARPLVFLAPEPERWDWDRSERPNGILLWMPVTIYWINTADQTDDNSLLKTYTKGCADVEQAIAADLSRGGLAHHTRIQKQTFSATGGEVWSIVDVELQVRRIYGQPNG